MDEAVIAMITSRTFTASCMPPQDPIRISVLAPKSRISSLA